MSALRIAIPALSTVTLNACSSHASTPAAFCKAMRRQLPKQRRNSTSFLSFIAAFVLLCSFSLSGCDRESSFGT